MTEGEKLVFNERTKITAVWLNTLASGAIITGVVAPAIAVIFDLRVATDISPWSLAASSLAWLSVGVALHWLARWTLRRLEP